MSNNKEITQISSLIKKYKSQIEFGLTIIIIIFFVLIVNNPIEYFITSFAILIILMFILFKILSLPSSGDNVRQTYTYRTNYELLKEKIINLHLSKHYRKNQKLIYFILIFITIIYFTSFVNYPFSALLFSLFALFLTFLVLIKIINLPDQNTKELKQNQQFTNKVIIKHLKENNNTLTVLDKNFCQHCFEPLIEEEIFCSNCGQKILSP